MPAPVCVGQADGAKVVTNTPGKDLDVRRAIQAAVDVKAIDQRANDGKGSPATTLFDKSFPWDPGVAGPKYDVEEAKRLVSAAKAKGWDGKIRVLCNNTPSRQNFTLALESMLKAVGIDVQTTFVNDVQVVVNEVIVNKNFDMACWGLTASPDDGTQAQLDSFLRSASGSNRVGYKSAAMEAALADLKKANTAAARTAAYKKIAEQWNADAPSVAIASLVERLTWNKTVHGLVPTALTNVLFDKAWIEK
ncbi:MAG TPA: ABC transporter substrate-binding protein [Acidimicrobiales bacterium]|nr:ABC transporter substrate-binding protein [Acidimicrobiales bacterium]